jgi:hypothetical protein
MKLKLMTWVRSKAFIAACVAVAVAAIGSVVGILLTSHTAPVHKAAAPPRPVVVKPKPKPKKGPLLSPFTGEPIKSLGPVMAVKIDNIIYARPQTGLQDADIIYVLPVEGGLTRFMAIFSSHFPPIIGPVRSAREDDIYLLRQFNRPAFVWSGAQPYLVPVVEHSRIIDLYANLVGGFFRDPNRIAPYNLYANTRTLLKEAKGASKAHNIGFTFGAGPGGGRKTSSFTVNYPAATYTFRWSAAKKGWLVWMDGSPAMLTNGHQMDPHTVVIQYTYVRTSAFLEQGALRPPFANTIGSGKAIVLRNGEAFTAHWVRKYAAYGTTFTTLKGKPMNFARGQVWIVLTAYNRIGYRNESN